VAEHLLHDRQRDAPAEPPDHREAAAVLADVIARDGAELSATEYRQRQVANADHLGLLDAMWQDAIAGPRTERYRQLLLEVVPPAYVAAADESAKATWLWRTLRAVEAAGLDAREVMRAAVNSRDLAGARDVAAVIDDRIRKQADVGRLVPLTQGSVVPAGHGYVPGDLAGAADNRQPPGGVLVQFLVSHKGLLVLRDPTCPRCPSVLDRQLSGK
jgi:hypothetical protein